MAETTSSFILEKIQSLIKDLEKYRYVQKVIRTKGCGYPEIPKKVKEIYGGNSLNIGSRFNPKLIKIIEEIGEEEAYPLYLDSVSLLPGQKVELRFCEGTGESYYQISWDLPIGDYQISHREFTLEYTIDGASEVKSHEVSYGDN